MADKNQTSTAQSYLDQAAGTIQSAIGSLTGSTADKAQGENRKSTATAEHTLSHTSATAGPITTTPAGGLATANPDRSAGAWNQNVGALKESIGGFVGAEGLKQDGIQQNAEGRGQEAQGQVRDLGKGVQDRVGGVIGGAVAGVVGNEAQKEEARRQREDGKARVRGVEADLQKQAAQ
ncbi:hypothetical protein C7974DRAFT_336773 [Boeremia exigua]|uniref:uncharacterized protein n=1 Tax=Boeremia exigua TaxID=749465 RepID=UPI001E8DBD95|nr:uncharacterized protein C7974DRAFT_336773 [Boeremia exigua]KAH6625140.1 hypothetical protein C7974DRAFT_336773 [Boeremia exigua]